MTPAIILDVLTGAILVWMVLRGSWRGLFLSLSGVLVLIAALLGASFGAKTLAEPVTDWATPIIQEHIARQVETALRERTPTEDETLGDLLPENLKALLDRTGLTETLQEKLAHQAEESIAATGSAIAAAIARELVRSFVYAILYILIFLVLLLVLRLAVLSLNLVLRLPLLRSVNALGGAALGLVEGMMLIYLALWLLPKFGVQLPTEGTRLLSFFTAAGPLRLLAF